MSKINIHRGTFLEKEELTRMIEFLTNRPEINAILAASVSFGLVSPGGKAGTSFKVTASTQSGSINIIGGYVIDSELKSYLVENQLNYPVPNDNKYYWLKISPFSRNYENGTVQVDTSGNVSGTVNFQGVVRGQSSGVPTCIRFVKEDGSQPLNNGVYQVVDIINNNNIILSSGLLFQAESDLKVIVLGSVPMGRRFTEEQLEGLYTFDSYKLSLIEEPSGGTMPNKDVNEYFIARVRNNGGSITVLDERAEFWSLGGTGGAQTFTISINPTPADAQVLIDGVKTNSVEAVNGRTLIWSVSKPGYFTRSGNYTVNGKSETLNIVLEKDPNPTKEVTITVKTQNGETTEGAVSVNNSSTINKAQEEITVEVGSSVQICASPAAGYKFAGWLKDDESFSLTAIQDIVAEKDTVFTATFIEDTQAEFWDFETKVSEGGTDTELFTVPTQAGTGEYEGVMVKVNE